MVLDTARAARLRGPVTVDGMGPTEGCVGLALPILLRLLAVCGPGSTISIAPP